MYNFRKDAKVYIELPDGSLFNIDVYPDLNFSQTFVENSVNTKTLHNQLALNKGSTIVEANPANFSFTTPLRFGPNSEVYQGFESDYSSGNINPINIYVEFTDKKYLLEKSVLESIVYNIPREGLLSMSISGSAARLLEDVEIPLDNLSLPNTDPYTIVRCIDIEIDEESLGSIAAINIEVNNSIEWIANTTIHSTLQDGITYRENYVLTERRVSGSITKFVTEDNYGQEFNTKGSILIKLSSEIGQNPPFLTFTLPEAVYTRRTNIDELITQVYDFRLLLNELQLIPRVRS